MLSSYSVINTLVVVPRAAASSPLLNPGPCALPPFRKSVVVPGEPDWCLMPGRSKSVACPALNVPAILGVCCASIFSPLAQTPLTAEVDRAVEQMRGMSMTIQAAGRVTGREAKRRAITKQLHDLGPAAIFALARLLHDGDVQMRQNAALVLSNLGGGYEEETKPPLDTRGALPALIDALSDDDRDVRAWAAGAIGWMVPGAVPAIGALVKLLRDPYEGARNNACIALGRIGPAAREALPALREALNNPSRDVRQFAAAAVRSIEGK